MAQEPNFYQALAQAFSIGELQRLCADLSIDHESIGGPDSIKDVYILNLVA